MISWYVGFFPFLVPNGLVLALYHRNGSDAASESWYPYRSSFGMSFSDSGRR